jgi:hypothetical protein
MVFQLPATPERVKAALAAARERAADTVREPELAGAPA